MKKSKKLISLLLALVMLLSIIPMAAAADGTIVYDGVTLYTTKKPTDSTELEGVKGSAITKNVGENGVYQRLPRDTNIHTYCNTVIAEFIPEYYAASTATVELSDPTVLSDFSYTISGWQGNDEYKGEPCLTFNFTAAKSGSTTVKLTYYYNYNHAGETGYCNGCGRLVSYNKNYLWYKQTSTFTVTVGDGEVPTPSKPDKPTESDVNNFFGRVNSTSTSEGAVYMWCDTFDHQAWFNYITDVDDAYTLGDVVANDGSVMSKTTYPWICVMTLDANKYLDAYNNFKMGTEYGTHYLKDGQSETQSVTWYWNATKNKWQYREKAAPVYIDITHTAPTPEVKEFTVSYTDGVDGAAFADQTYTVKEGDPTPAFDGTPAREGYVFLGWEPEVAGTVTANATYTATWEEALTEVKVTSSISEGALLYLGSEFKVTATANTDAKLTFNFEANPAFRQIASDATGNSKTVWYRVVKITGNYTKINVSVTGTKGNQEPVTGTLSFGVNLRNRIHVTIKNTAGEIISNVTNIKLNHKYPKWNTCPALKYDAAKQEYVMKNPWDLSSQEFVSVTFDYEGDTYETKVTKDGRNLFDVIRAGEEEIYVECTVVEPIYVTVEVNGDEVKTEKFKGKEGEKLNYSALYWEVMGQIQAEGKIATVQILIDGAAGTEAVFGTNKNVKIVITTIG